LLTAYDDKLATDVTTEQSEPEVQITEVPQATENSFELEVLAEWLQDESMN